MTPDHARARVIAEWFRNVGGDCGILAEAYLALADEPRPLTKTQREIYDYVAEYIAANGYAPTQDEIATHFAYSTLATVHEHLTNLERKGWIRRTYNECRSIEIVGANVAALRGVGA